MHYDLKLADECQNEIMDALELAEGSQEARVSQECTNEMKDIIQGIISKLDILCSQIKILRNEAS